MHFGTGTLRRGRARSRAVAAIVMTAAVIGLAGCSSTPAAEPPPSPAEQQPTGGALTKTDVDAWLDGMVPSTLASTGIPGASVSVVAGGRILTSRGYGVADTGTTAAPRRQVDPSGTVFRLASISKTLTATAVMQLVEQSRLDLDADIHRYIDFPLPTPQGKVTLRNLLTHTAGFEERFRGLIAFGHGPDLRQFVADDPPEQVFAPGTMPAYSNYGYSLAGYIVQRVSGLPFATYMQEYILEPAGMTSSTFVQPVAAPLATHLAAGYPDDSKPPIPEEIIPAVPAGALSSTATDMGRFMLAQLGALPGGRRILKPATLKLMHEPALDAATLGSLAEGRRMTLGFFDQRTNGHDALGHEGDSTVFHSMMQFYPRDGVGIFIALNGNGRGAADAYALRTALMDGFAHRYLPSASGERTGDTQIDPSLTAAQKLVDARATAGTYESTRSSYSTFISMVRLVGQTRVVAREDGTIVVSGLPGQFSPARYEELQPGLWRQTGGETLVVTRPTDGRVTTISTMGALSVSRVDPAHDAALVVPVTIGSIVVLILAVLAWPAGALLRRRYHAAAAPIGLGRVARISTRIGVVAALAAVAGWMFTVLSVLGYDDVPDAPLRVLQALQVIGLVAIAPAALRVVDAIRHHEGGVTTTGRAFVMLALGGLAWVALVFGLIAPSVSY